jgi:hypothetical protein
MPHMTTRQADAAIRSGLPVMVVEIRYPNNTPLALNITSRDRRSVWGNYVNEAGAVFNFCIARDELEVVAVPHGMTIAEALKYGYL